MSNRLLVFDCDGTLVDSQASIVGAMQAAFRDHGMTPPAPEAVRRVVGLPLAPAIQRLMPAAADIAAAEEIAGAYRQAFSRLRRAGMINDPLYPGVRETVAELESAGWLLGVATGKGRRGLDLSLEAHGLSDRFVTLQTADGNPGKPAPDMLINAMADAGAGPDTTVMVGDTTYDMEMSRNAGTLAIGVAWGYHEAHELTAGGACRVLSGFDELMPCLADVLA